MEAFTPHTLIISGIIFEVIGAFILALEAFGKKRVKNIVKKIDNFSQWAKKRLINMLLVIFPFIGLTLIGFLFNSEVLVGLAIPFALLSIIQATIIDDARAIVDWESRPKKFKKIGPYGFILLLVGNLLQVISVIWQMAME